MYRRGEEEAEAAARAVRSGFWFRYSADGEHPLECAHFESEWCKAFDVKYSCFTTSGTSALLCCYAGLSIGPGDEVIIPGYTWIATATAVLHMGAIPIMVDVDESLMIDPDAIEKAISPRTKAICPVHMTGLACDMDRIMAIAKKHDILVIEDTCQCDGGWWKDGKRLGTIGHMGAYSFNIYKVISCGDGGMFVTDDRRAYEKALILHDSGVGFRSHAGELEEPLFAGINVRGNEILAAVMRVQLSRLDGIVTDLHRVRDAIADAVGDAPGVSPIPFNGGWETGTGATLGYRFPNEDTARKFAMEFRQKAAEVGAGAGLPIDSGRHIYSNWESVMNKQGGHTEAANTFLHPANSNPTVEYTKDMLPRTLEILSTTATVPVNPDWTDKQVEVVATAVRDAAGSVSK